MQTIQRFWADETGATAIEYGLIASLIAISIIGGAGLLGTQLGASFNYVKNKIKTS